VNNDEEAKLIIPRLFLYVTLDRLGRRWTTVITHVTLGVCFVAMAFIPKNMTGLILALFLLAKGSSTAGFSVSNFDLLESHTKDY
jgi:hypothetical protein